MITRARRTDRVTRVSSTGGAVVPTTGMMSHLRVTDLDEFTDIERYTEAARDWWERQTSRATLNATYQLKRDAWPDEVAREYDEEIELPRAPLQGSTNVSVTYVTEDGSTSTFSSTAYIVDDGGDHNFPRIHLKDAEDWPTETLQEANAITVEWKAGYGSTHSDLPQGFRQGVKLTVGHFYENREGVVAEGVIPREMPFAIRALVSTYKIPSIP